MPHDLNQNARFFYPRDSGDSRVEQVVNDVADILSLGGLSKQRRILKYLLLDFRQRQIELPNGWIYCSRDRNSNKFFYQLTEPYASLGISYNPLVSILDKLKDAGMIEMEMGDVYDDTPAMTKVRPTEALLPYLNAIPENLVRNLEEVQPLVLKHKQWRVLNGRRIAKKVRIRFPETEHTRLMAEDVRFFNSKFKECQLDIYNPSQFDPGSELEPGFKQTQVNINLNSKYLHRVFNEDFEHGGRFYGGWWQSVPSKIRPYILIDGVPTVEVDFKGYHIALLYSLSGINYFEGDGNQDPYRVEGWNRADVKLLLQIVLNCKKQNVIDAYNNARTDEGKEPIPADRLKSLIAIFEEMHRPIKPYFYNGLGITLQNIDAQIAASVMRDCMNTGILDEDGVYQKFITLPVHDSFIVKEQYKEQLKSAMERAVEENILAVSHFTGMNMSYFEPSFDATPPADLSTISRDDAFYERITLHSQGAVLPELRIIKRSNEERDINLFCIDYSPLVR